MRRSRSMRRRVSYMRKEFRATAESRKRPPLVAEAMVDPDVVIAGVIAKGKLLTLTTTEALKLKVADVRADSLEAVLKHLELPGAEVRRPTPNWAEQRRPLPHASRDELAPHDRRHPGHHRGAADARLRGARARSASPASDCSSGATGWCAWRAGRKLLLVTLGLILLALEIFVIPGFGVAGVLGILALGGGLASASSGPGPRDARALCAGSRGPLTSARHRASPSSSSASCRACPTGAASCSIPGSTRGRGIASAPESDLTVAGQKGTAATPLRPAGIADLQGNRVDVVSRGRVHRGGGADRGRSRGR